MLHLSTERLAALADDEPTDLEAGHLASCAECTRERAAHAAVVRLASVERSRIAPPITEWSRLAERLREESVIASPPRRRLVPLRAMARAAAAILLVTAGAAVGRVSAGERALPWVNRGAGGVARDVASQPPATFASADEALRALQEAEVSYQEALQYLVSLDASTLPQRDDVLRGRLAVLDQIASTTARAIDDVPYDPVLNSYYLSTLGAREATLRQLGAALPEGVTLTSY